MNWICRLGKYLIPPSSLINPAQGNQVIRQTKEIGEKSNRDTRIQGYRDTWTQEYRDTGIQGQRDTRYMDTGIQGPVRGYRGHYRNDTLSLHS